MDDMEHEEIAAHVGAQITDAISFDTEARQETRLRALQYIRGEMPDTPHEEARSKVTTSELADVISWIMPGLMRVFAGSSGVVKYDGRGPDEEQQAAQATDYIQAVFENDCDGYRVLWCWFYDALYTGNGIVKYWWDDATEVKVEHLQNLSEDQAAFLIHIDPTLKVLGYSQNDDQTLNLKVQRTEKQGRMRVEPIPPEEFLIDRNARSIDDAAFVAHRSKKTRSDLIKMGYERELIEEMPASYSIDSDATDLARGNTMRDGSRVASDDSIDYFECFTQFDVNDDGVSEWIKVCAAGSASAPTILHIEEWDEEVPFADIVPEIIPHSWQGRAISDSVLSIQQVNTVLLRQTLDNLYATNMPQRAVDANRVENPDELINPTFGGVIRTKGDPRTIVHEMTVPFVANHSLEAMQFMAGILQRRTGIAQAAMALDGDALVPQTATAKQIEHDTGYAKLEVIARNFAETGVKRLFRGLLRLIVRHQDRPRTMRIRNKWVDFDPRAWNAAMDVRVNVGLGTGSRERDLAMLARVALEQDKVVEKMGAKNPIVTPSMWVETRQKMVAAAGLKDGDQYFADVDPQQFEAFMAEKAASTPPDPKLAAVKMQSEAKMQEIQASQQTEMQKAQRDAANDEHQNAREVAQMQTRIELEREDSEYKRQIAQEKHQNDMEMLRLKQQGEIAKMTHEANREALRAQLAMVNANTAAQTSNSEPQDD